MAKVSIKYEKITPFGEGKAYRLVIQRERRLDGEQDLWEGEYTYRCILTNDYARHYQLNIYTDNKSYQNPFAFTDG
jgi:hypothetical protein